MCGNRVLSCFFQQRDDLFPLHTGKSFEELLDGIARLQMIEQALYRDTRPRKNRFASEDFRILRHDAAHERNYALKAHSIQANILITVTCLPSRSLARRLVTRLPRRSLARRRVTAHF